MQGHHKPICKRNAASTKHNKTRWACISHQLQPIKQLPLNHVLTAWVQGERHLLQFPWRTWQKARAVKRGRREMRGREDNKDKESSSSSEGSNNSWRKPQSSAGWVSSTDPGPCQGSHVNPRGCAGSWPKAPGLGHRTEDFWISEPSAQETHYMSLTQWIPANQQLFPNTWK